MSEENVEVLRRAYAAYNEHPDQDPLAQLVGQFCEPDVEWWPVQEPSPQRGQEAVVRAITGWFDAWNDIKIEAREFRPWSEGVIVTVRVSGRGKGSGVPMSEEFWHVFVMEDGKVRRFREYQSRGEALEAAGLSE